MVFLALVLIALVLAKVLSTVIAAKVFLWIVFGFIGLIVACCVSVILWIAVRSLFKNP